jgi:hypothetical protein
LSTPMIWLSVNRDVFMEISSGKDYEKIPLLGSANLWGDYPLKSGTIPSAADESECALNKLAEANWENLWTTPARNVWMPIRREANSHGQCFWGLTPNRFQKGGINQLVQVGMEGTHGSLSFQINAIASQ